jgi:hypothetical protein
MSDENDKNNTGLVNPSPIVHARVTPAMYEQLEKICEETGKNLSSLGCEALQAYIGMYLNARKK